MKVFDAETASSRQLKIFTHAQESGRLLWSSFRVLRLNPWTRRPQERGSGIINCFRMENTNFHFSVEPVDQNIITFPPTMNGVPIIHNLVC